MDIKNFFIICISSLLVVGCDDVEGTGTMEAPMEISLDFGTPATKSDDPDELAVSDVNILLYDDTGHLERSIYLPDAQPDARGKVKAQLRVVRGLPMSIVCCANLGTDLSLGDGASLQQLKESRYWMNYPDEYKDGIPAAGIVTRTFTGSVSSVEVPMDRLMSKISVRMDRTALASGVEMDVRYVKVGNCPKSALLLGKSYARTKSDVFSSGFVKTGEAADSLNMDASLGVSEEVSVYMLENMQGTLLEDVSDDDGKVLDEIPVLAQVCSYIELGIEYRSDEYYTEAGDYLKYRFYLGEDRANFDVERNCHYHFTLCPEGDGLGSESDWRVDRSALAYGDD